MATKDTEKKEKIKIPPAVFPADPENIKQIDFTYIVDYVQDVGMEAIEWLQDLYQQEVEPNKNGKERKISFIEIRNAFVAKYMPDLMPEPKAKKPQMGEVIMALKPIRASASEIRKRK